MDGCDQAGLELGGAHRRPIDAHDRIGRPAAIGPGATASSGPPPGPARRAERWASAPAMRTTSTSPAAMAVAARLTSHWGEFPPTVVVSVRAGAQMEPLGQLGVPAPLPPGT